MALALILCGDLCHLDRLAFRPHLPHGNLDPPTSTLTGWVSGVVSPGVKLLCNGLDIISAQWVMVNQGAKVVPAGGLQPLGCSSRCRRSGSVACPRPSTRSVEGKTTWSAPRTTNLTSENRIRSDFDDRSGEDAELAMHDLHNHFVGVTNGKFAGTDVKATTLDTCLNNERVALGAIQANRLQKSSNIRYTLVTCSLHFPATCMSGRSSRPSQQSKLLLGELYSRSMHSQSQAESTYSLALCDDHHARLPTLDQRLTFDNFILHL